MVVLIVKSQLTISSVHVLGRAKFNIRLNRLYEDDDTEGEDALSPNLDNIITNNNDSESKVEHWKNPSFTVTDFDMDDEDDDSADYAADSDDCSL
uniref:Uncharacterized protein n=1 Tax=Timema monikensis TaxID=170555 RepID=A0A7R9E0M4_9NEOP|nr:unnamed protein product [Timema monikensis]